MNRFLKRLNKTQLEKGVHIQSGISELLKAVQSIPDTTRNHRAFYKYRDDYKGAVDNFEAAKASLNKTTHGDQ